MFCSCARRARKVPKAARDSNFFLKQRTGKPVCILRCSLPFIRPLCLHESTAPPEWHRALPPYVSARRRRHAGAAVSRCDATGRGAACGGREAAPHGRIETNMGILPQFFFPGESGARLRAHARIWKSSRRIANQLTVFSGVSHPGVTGGHAAEQCFLTGTPHPERGGFRNWVSLDQFAAEQIGNRTRYPSLVLAMTQRRRDAELHAQRRADPGRAQPEEAVPKALRAGQARRSRRQRRGAPPGPQHARLSSASSRSG